MALDRTNMVSLLDIGSLMGGKTSKIVEMGDGYKEITEDWGPNTQSDQYVNMKNASNTVKGYALSMTPDAIICLMRCRQQSTLCSRRFRLEKSVIPIITDFTRRISLERPETALGYRLLYARPVPADLAETTLHLPYRSTAMEMLRSEPLRFPRADMSGL